MMNLSETIRTIYEGLIRFMPVFRIVWAITVVCGIAMLMIAAVLKTEPERKKSPWIVGGIGLLLTCSSGMQLVTSLF